MKQKSKSRREFRVGIAGILLPPEAADRIARAVQRAVLTELAGMDLKVGVGIRFIGNGGTQGIELIARRKGG